MTVILGGPAMMTIRTLVRDDAVSLPIHDVDAAREAIRRRIVLPDVFRDRTAVEIGIAGWTALGHAASSFADFA
ncbi:hypothetical protein IC762_17595 [Bradyrhizobium genosp. L]|uniref:hypothetical protein n=1 Tax=Bradyrhizobium genosp. L TaxID=83637 RepID=UPI0018A31D7A|nr:hypothetical protein [Bradyrhizobium genosp. L]QPF81640.1 hypothetical protein IC762_17595 [Bradyrhizobium genosp. L]